MTLDLHGIKHQDVGRCIDVFLWEHIQRKTPYVIIITGHSKAMKYIVNEIANEYGITYREMLNPGSVILEF